MKTKFFKRSNFQKNILTKLVFSVYLFLSCNLLANTVDSTFKTDSLLPATLKIEILNFLNENCSAGIQPFGLRELETISFSANSFETQFLSIYSVDGYHPTRQIIKVRSKLQSNEQILVSLDQNANCN